MLMSITSRSSGDCSFRTRIYLQTSIKLRLITTRWQGRYLISKTSTRTHWFLRSWLSPTSFCTDWDSSNISRSYFRRLKRDKLDPRSKESCSRLKLKNLKLKMMTPMKWPLLIKPQLLLALLENPRERSISEGLPKKLTEPSSALMRVVANFSDQKVPKIYTLKSSTMVDQRLIGKD